MTVRANEAKSGLYGRCGRRQAVKYPVLYREHDLQRRFESVLVFLPVKV